MEGEPPCGRRTRTNPPSWVCPDEWNNLGIRAGLGHLDPSLDIPGGNFDLFVVGKDVPESWIPHPDGSAFLEILSHLPNVTSQDLDQPRFLCRRCGPDTTGNLHDFGLIAA